MTTHVFTDARACMQCWAPDDGRVVAQYDLRPPGQPARDKSGNVLTIFDEAPSLAIGMFSFSTWSSTTAVNRPV